LFCSRKGRNLPEANYWYYLDICTKTSLKKSRWQGVKSEIDLCTFRTWAVYRIRYSDWLRAGRSGDRIPAWARFSAPVQTGRGAHPSSCTIGTGSFPGVKSGRGVTLAPHPFLVPLVMKE
jgi:hypothetical protein